MTSFSNSGFTRRGFIKSAAIGFASLALFGRKPALAKKAAKPNVVLVITDDQGYGDLACHGNPWIKTPNMDKLHGESIRLTNFHVGPTCAPTRAALMTGRYCNRTGVWHTIMGRSLIRQDEVTIADVFGKNGYKTGAFGKWHLGDNYPSRPFDKGFQETFMHGGGGVMQTPDFWSNDYFDDTYFHNGVPTKCEGYCTDIWFDRALKFIESNRDSPFFAYIPTNAPHGPFNVAEKYSRPYEEMGIPSSRAAFYGMITNIDENMAKLYAKLDELGLSENTILIFMTDNGSAAGFKANGKTPEETGFNVGMRGTKGSEYEGGHRVPFFIRWPAGGLGGGVDIDRLTAHVDVLPTLADLCGISTKGTLPLDGKSIKKLLENPDARWRNRVLVTDSQRIENPEKWRKSATMTDKWRLVNGEELYEIKVDPGQEHDLAGQHPEVVKKLRAEYEKWWDSVSERFDEYCRIILGSDKENPSSLTAHDWHTGKVPWNHRMIKANPVTNGPWAVEVERAGTYTFELRRWSKDHGGPAGALNAKMRIFDIEQEKDMKPSDAFASFKLKLKAGKTMLQTWLTDEKGTERGAFFVYVKRQ